MTGPTKGSTLNTFLVCDAARASKEGTDKHGRGKKEAKGNIKK